MLCGCSYIFFNLYACLWINVTDRDGPTTHSTTISSINRVWEGPHNWTVRRRMVFCRIGRHLNRSDRTVRMCCGQTKCEDIHARWMGSGRGRQTIRRKDRLIERQTQTKAIASSFTIHAVVASALQNHASTHTISRR